jgi:amidase
MDVELDEHVIAAWEATSELLAGLGHEVLDVPAPLPPEAVAAFETVWTVGAAGLVIDPERESQLRPLTRHLRAVGATVTGVEYANALGELSHYSRLGLAATADLDVLMTPTLGQLPVPVGWFDAGGDPALDFERQKQFTPFTALYNSTGQPAISLPLQISPDGLPIGMMFAGRPGGEATLLALAASLEFAAPWRARKPPIWSM